MSWSRHRRGGLVGSLAVLLGVTALVPAIVTGPAAAEDTADTTTTAAAAPDTGGEAGPVPELSTANSTTVREPDGSLTATVSSAVVNYQNESGAWVPIDNTLVDAPGATYDVQNAANSFTTRLPEDPSTTPVKMTTDAGWVTMRMHGLDDTPAEVDGDTATYTDPATADADAVTYQVTTTGLKENITLDQPPTEPVSYTYTLQASAGLSPVLQADGTITLTDRTADSESEPAFVIPAGLMYDTAGDDGGDDGNGTGPAISDAVAYDLQADSTGGWTLTVTPDQAWLTDPARVYPVTIDPTLADGHQVDRRDCSLYQGTPDTVHCGDATPYLKAGRSDASHKVRGVFDFNVSAIPTTATITKAEVHLYLDKSQTLDNSKTANYALYKAGKKFNSSATWNTSGANGTWTGGGPGNTAYGTRAMNGDTSGDKSFDGLEDLVQKWVNNDDNNTGLVLKQADEGINNILAFYSNADTNGDAKKPYITIKYTTPTVGLTGFVVTPTAAVDALDGLQGIITVTEPSISVTTPNVTSDIKMTATCGGDERWSASISQVPPSTLLTRTVSNGSIAFEENCEIQVLAIYGSTRASLEGRYYFGEIDTATPETYIGEDPGLDDPDLNDDGPDDTWEDEWGPFPAGGSNSGQPLAAAVPCVFVTDGDFVRIKSLTGGVKQLRAHGWWLKGTCKDAKLAMVKIKLQTHVGGNNWLTIATGQRTIKPGTSKRALAYKTCTGTAILDYHVFRSLIDVNIIGQPDTPERAYTQPRGLQCRWY